ncbi:enoyl-CoA hydratase/isomerase family protein [Salimicrobium flavidum]|uniref:Ethylmalonyl-CoA decarboxylase n=1 Tax=Salimicrobium flavidum TaxID=570947 RepID=A0A1N7ILM2_9BACI|nr:enoyl-CoA hydratase/isomerase family protein [Salimicrobium flavidum]SIS37969.1 Enoyl-CoA hydratase/carnithine racemase [Salimicrobium flavidum]
METVEVTNEKDIVIVTLDRPYKRNAVNRIMIEELKQVIEQVKYDENLKAFVLTAKGEDAFCAGGDLRDLHGELSKEEAFALLSQMRLVLYDIATLPVPTLALLNGEARGGGCELATACDLRIGKNGDSYGFVQGKLGIIPGWGGGALLYERISSEETFRWLMRSEMLKSSEALRIGWLQEVSDSPDFTLFSGKSKEQLRFWKKQFLKRLNEQRLYEMMEEETRQASELWGSKAHKEAIQAFYDRNQKRG